MSWILELAIGIGILIISGGIATYLISPSQVGGKNGVSFSKSSGDRLFVLLLLVGIVFLIWAYTANRWIWAPEESAVVLQASVNADEHLNLLLENQRRLWETVKHLEEAAERLGSRRPETGLGIVLEIAIGICLIVATGGTISYVLKRQKHGGKGVKPDRAKRMEDRLDTLEQRLTDIQDVVISLDEKLSIGKSGS